MLLDWIFPKRKAPPPRRLVRADMKGCGEVGPGLVWMAFPRPLAPLVRPQSGGRALPVAEAAPAMSHRLRVLFARLKAEHPGCELFIARYQFRS